MRLIRTRAASKIGRLRSMALALFVALPIAFVFSGCSGGNGNDRESVSQDDLNSTSRSIALVAAQMNDEVVVGATSEDHKETFFVGARVSEGSVESITEIRFSKEDEPYTFTLHDSGLPASLALGDEYSLSFTNFINSNAEVALLDNDGQQIGSTFEVDLDAEALSRAQTLYNEFIGKNGDVSRATLGGAYDSRNFDPDKVLSNGRLAALAEVGAWTASAISCVATPIGAGIAKINAGLELSMPQTDVDNIVDTVLTVKASCITSGVGLLAGIDREHNELDQFVSTIDEIGCEASNRLNVFACASAFLSEWASEKRGEPAIKIMSHTDGEVITRGEKVYFTASENWAYNKAEVFSWEMGDVSYTLIGKTIDHIYAVAGTYTVVATVQYTDGAIASDTITVTVQDSQLLPPTSVSATPGNAQVSLNWSDVPGATSYNLYFSTLDGTAENGQVIRGISNTSYTHTGLSNSTAYYYVVRAVGTGGVESQPSSEVSATPAVADGGMIMGRYQPMGSQGEIIKDVVTGLEWQRCSVGQTWNPGNQSCDGSATFHNWNAAIELTAPGGFRIPTIEELRTIVYCSNTGNFDSNGNNNSCGSWGTYDRPTIVLEAFPNTSISNVWSSSPDHSNDGWYMSFSMGHVDSGYINDFVRVDRQARLVRVGQ